MSEILNITERINNIDVVTKKRQNPTVSILIFIVSIVIGWYATLMVDGHNISFALLFISVILAVIGLKGILLPKKILQYIPTGEKIVKKEYYYETKERPAVENCLKSKLFATLNTLPQGQESGLRVVLYTTISGSYAIAQMQQYVPYEYKPVYDIE